MSQLAQAMIDHYAPGIRTPDLVAHLYATLTHEQATPDVVEAFSARVRYGKEFPTQGALMGYAALLDINTVELMGFEGSILLPEQASF